MSIQDVTSRIATIEQHLSMLSARASTLTTSAATTAAPATATSSGTAFTQALNGVLSGVTSTSDLPATGSLADLGATTTATAGTPGAPASGEAVVAQAQKYLGTPYVWGGTDPAKGLDCSGLVQRVYRDLGVELPRVSRDQATMGTPVAGLAEARPGDLLAFGSPVHHIGIYAGNNMMVEAPRTGLDVRVAPLSETPTAIRRILGSSAAGGSATGFQVAASPGAIPAASPAAQAVGSTPYADLFARAAAAHGIDAGLLAAVAKQESGFNSSAVSPAGAQGLMQLMPATARGLGVTNSFEPAQAVDGAARLLSGLMDRFGRTDLALAAYNAGPGAVLRYGGVPPYPETQRYVRSVMSMAGAS